MSTLARQLSSRVVNSIRKWEGARLKGPARMSAPDCVIIFIMVTLGEVYGQGSHFCPKNLFSAATGANLCLNMLKMLLS